MGELNSVIEWLVLARNEKCLPGEEAAFDKAISILKAQESVKVIHRTPKVQGFRNGNCPKCGALLNQFHNANNCGQCGQKVKWE